MREGQNVAWDGMEVEGHLIGDQGRLLALAGRGAHITWTSGHLAGVTELVALDDLSTTASTRDVLADSLDFGGLSTIAARDVYETEGPEGVVNAMASLGHLSSFESIAEEALALVASRIRHDPSFREVTAQLDEEESEATIRLASAVLIRDAFGTEE